LLPGKPRAEGTGKVLAKYNGMITVIEQKAVWRKPTHCLCSSERLSTSHKVESNNRVNAVEWFRYLVIGFFSSRS